MAKATDLEKIVTPFGIGSKEKEAPITTVVGKLTETKGHELEIMARLTNSHMITAMQLGYVMTETYNSRFVGGMKDQLLRLSISKDGLGRRDIIDALEKGSKLPDTYYGSSMKHKVWEVND